MPYDTEADIPLPILGNILNNVTRPDLAADRMATAGGEGSGGAVRTALMQLFGGAAGAAGVGSAVRSALAGKFKKSPIALLASTVAAGTAGLGGGVAAGGALAQGMHNSQSRDQFGKALSGSLSPGDVNSLPQGLLKLLSDGHPEKAMELFPKSAPDIAARPYVRQLFDSQREV